jgi:DUF438 domain-containing protein
MINLATEKYGEAFDRFKNNNQSVNVEYSLIRSGQELEGKAIVGEHMKVQSEKINEYCQSIGITTEEYCAPNKNDYTRQGLATKMYKVMADYLALNNQVLIKGMTNDFSDPLWENKIKNNPDFGYSYNINNDFESIDNSGMDTSYLLVNKDSTTLSNDSNNIFVNYNIDFEEPLFLTNKSTNNVGYKNIRKLKQ